MRPATDTRGASGEPSRSDATNNSAAWAVVWVLWDLCGVRVNAQLDQPVQLRPAAPQELFTALWHRALRRVRRDCGLMGRRCPLSH